MRPRRIYGALIIQNYVKEAAVLVAAVGDEKSRENNLESAWKMHLEVLSHDILPPTTRRCLESQRNHESSSLIRHRRQQQLESSYTLIRFDKVSGTRFQTSEEINLLFENFCPRPRLWKLLRPSPMHQLPLI